MAENNEEEAVPQAGGGTKKLILIMVVSVLVSVGAAVGVTLALTGGKDDSGEAVEQAAEEEEEPATESMYVDLEPEFVINFQDKNGRPKFLKAEMAVSTTDEEVSEAVERHMPAIRNSLVLLLSRQIYDDLLPNEGKEKLRAEALAAVQEVLEAEIGQPGVTGLYFSTFVMQ